MGVHPPGSVFREDGRKDYEVHRFGHWACGWLEIILVRPGTPCAQEAEECENALADYPVLNDSDHSELEHEEAQKTWSACFSVRERIEYMWDHQSDFEHCFWRGSDPITHQQRTVESETEEHAVERWRMILANVRGTCFSGTPSEILHR